ncbi:hypothetical protein ACFQ49_01300 [Kroppenstedtia eburnea]|uniref:Uncharacterized protein n=1 Tax=Kroppenstedtia eburnea TaxID=714067 RepID=A0A1N7PRS4_9BACL|nr:hypothetical protein [Kroppenstedtia eburnea]EGK12716.1 hypothetical protein HMPREF9374_1310 [Desmospora sp. 8437]QKI82692.1 hypothetical protein GXN75_12205 [Kroppenstedtia eburnea]SIT13245.1 hypothetical protein SAMN05421790_11435 [Kroppenstedtia eburnea]
MSDDFSTYQAYLERYKTFWSEEGDHRPPILTEESFYNNFRLLRESYDTYRSMINQGMEAEAAAYYGNVINLLENELAIADGFDNFLDEDFQNRLQ